MSRTRYGMYRVRSEHQQRVDMFSKMVGRYIPPVPTVKVGDNIRMLCARLIMEEALETVNALGFIVTIPSAGDAAQEDPDITTGALEPDLVEIADGCADLRVVATYTLSSFGLTDQSIQEAVDRANLKKVEGDAHLDEHGKWVKPSGWTPPPIERIIREQVDEAEAEMEPLAGDAGEVR